MRASLLLATRIRHPYFLGKAHLFRLKGFADRIPTFYISFFRFLFRACKTHPS